MAAATTMTTAPRGGGSLGHRCSSKQQPHHAAGRRAAAAAAATSLALALALLAAITPQTSASSGLPARVLTLTDANFEHDTQASTGQTTGHWAVLLFDSSAVKTRPATQTAQKALAALAASRAADPDASEEEAHDPGCLYASVDASEEANPALAARFRGFLPGPVLLLFRDRQLFPLPLPRVMLSQQQLERAGSGASRSEDQAVSAAYHAILDFLSGGFREVDSERIPPPAGGGGGALGGGGFAGKAIDFLARQTADVDGDHLMVIGVATVVIGILFFVGFFGLAVFFAGGGKVGDQTPVPQEVLAAAVAARASKKKYDGDAKPAPVPEAKGKEEEEEEEAEEVVAEGEEEEKEEEEEQAAGASADAGGMRRRRRHA